jgi:hypothetical protein
VKLSSWCGKGGLREYRRGGTMWKREGCEGVEGVCTKGDIRLCNCETPAPATVPLHRECRHMAFSS